jgi:hypothetical protein
MPRHAQQFAGDPNGDARPQATPSTTSRRNFLALVFCLMVGTAALPHILMRYYTTPSVREARESVTWSLFFIFLLYFTAPAWRCWSSTRSSVLVGHAVRPAAAVDRAWTKVDPALLSVVDINKDGILQLGEMKIGGDIIVLATPEIGGLPYVVSGMVAAGGLAAALSTADGLLLTIANALSHDLYYKMIDPNASTARRVRSPRCCCWWWPGGGLGGGAEAGRHPVPGLGGLLDSRRRPSSRRWCWASSGSGPTSGARCWHGGRAGRHLLLHGHHPALAARRVRRDLADRAVVGHPAHRGRACSACRWALR